MVRFILRVLVAALGFWVAAHIVPGVHVDAQIPVPSLHIGVGIGAPAVIVHERPVIIEERVRVKHDNGRHRGGVRDHRD